MKKKQASLIFPLYVLCAFLFITLAGSYVFKTYEEEEGDPVPVTKIIKVEEKVAFTPPEIRHPIVNYNSLPEEKSYETPDTTTTTEASEEDNQSIFENVLSVFTDWEEHEPIQPVTVPKPSPEGLAYVVVIIDDMGISRKWSREISKLSGPLTLSYLPYAEDLQAQADMAAKNHHHLMLHMPMEALGGKMSSTPGLLKVNTTQQDFLAQFYRNLDSFEGFYGINNHMGSRLTQDKTKMTLVMNALKKQGLYFIDSRTIHDSVAAETASNTGVPYLVRDVFLDHEDNLPYVRNALLKLERKARKDGVAIAIGHPKQVTYQGLKEWLPTLKSKNIQLIDAGDLIRKSYPDIEIHAYQAGAGKPLSSAAVHKVDQEAFD